MTGQIPAGHPRYGATITPNRIGYTITLVEQYPGGTLEQVPNYWRPTHAGALRLARRLIRAARAAEDRRQATHHVQEP